MWTWILNKGVGQNSDMLRRGWALNMTGKVVSVHKARIFFTEMMQNFDRYATDYRYCISADMYRQELLPIPIYRFWRYGLYRLIFHICWYRYANPAKIGTSVAPPSNESTCISLGSFCLCETGCLEYCLFIFGKAWFGWLRIHLGHMSKLLICPIEFHQVKVSHIFFFQIPWKSNISHMEFCWAIASRVRVVSRTEVNGGNGP